MENFDEPVLCPFCGGEKPSKKNAQPSVPCTCSECSKDDDLF